ncbi:NucA/NucB deoxyribonuclease domain-containing protein [Streptomyces sp. NPDC006365]|uniref:NucA/NucB deoxyribonuclease domain-containing protein n=1 Tax=Streptomyces sp. NPDC006365 TaxID=3364744 RepID=UPI0036A61837
MTGERESGSSRVKVSDVPSRSMTREECAAQTEVDATMWIRSRFAMCESTWLYITWLVNGRPVGVSQFTGNAIATVPDAKSRQIDLDYYFHDFVKVGTVPSGVVLTPSPEYTTVPKVTLYEGDVYPRNETWEQWAAQSPVHHSLWVEAPLGQGMAPDDGIWAIWNYEIKIKFPAGWVPIDDEMGFSSFGLRWDFAPYLGDAPGAALSYNVSPLRYSKSANEGEVALHIDDAINRPERTLPVNPNKKVPGTSPSDPLHRLYELYEPDRYEENRANAIAECVAADPDYASKGLDCDEYPFASTFEGTARADYEEGYPQKNWSARALGLSSNRSAGAQLNTYYQRNRILHGENDGYYLQIIP